MNRRELITLLGSAATWPVAAHAQQRMPVVGVLSSSSRTDRANAPLLEPGLKAAGYIEGQNIAIEYHWADGHYDQLPALALDLVRREVAVIYTSLAPATLAAKAATTTILIVFALGGEPVGRFVASMNRPGGNLTGVSFYTSGLGPKRLELLRELVPEAASIAFLVNQTNLMLETDTSEMLAAARSIGQRIVVLNASTPEEIDTAFATASREKASAILVDADPVFASRHDQLVALAARYRIPASYFNRDFTSAGGLMAYADDRSESLRQAGAYVGRILKGERPADLPVLQPTKFELVINLKTAKALGLTVPLALLARADEVIE